MKYLILICLLIATPCRAAVFYSDGYETGDFSKTGSNGESTWGEVGTAADSVTVSTDNPRTGTYSVKMLFGGSSDENDDALCELRYSLDDTAGQGYTEFYLRYWVYYPSNYTIRDVDPNNNKLATVWADTYGASGRQSFNAETSRSSGLANILVQSRTTGYPYTTLDCNPGLDIIDGPDAQRYTIPSADYEQWISFEFHYKIDTGAGNYIFELWVDDDLKISHTKDVPSAPCAINFLRNGYIFGAANSGFAQDTIIYVDDVEWSTTRIGGTTASEHTISGGIFSGGIIQ